MANGYGYESNQVSSLINLYRANPNLFDEEHLETLEQLASQQGMNFKPIKDTTTLTSLAKNFSGGFIRGLVPLVPPDDQPRTTYEAIARSLGHLAGFAPSILSLPLRGATIAATTVKGLAKGLGRKKIKKAVAERIETKGFYGQKAVGILDKMSLPMIGSRYIKGKMGHGITKLELDTLDYMKAGGVGRAIAEEAVGLGTASVISDIWAGPDDYMNVFFGGALAGGVFGGIGNWRALGNRLGAAKTESQRKGAESALKAAVGSAFMGLPATLRNEPIEMQLYEYLLGGFFGYQSRPAHEAAGGAFYKSIPSHLKTLTFRPEQVPGFSGEPVPIDPKFPSQTAERGGLSKKAQKYVMNEATENAEIWLNTQQELKNIDKWQGLLSARLKDNPKGNDLDVVEAETRSLAEDLWVRSVFEKPIIEVQGEPTYDDRIDPYDFYEPPKYTKNTMANDINRTLKGLTGKEIETLANEIDTITKNYHSTENTSSDVEGFINEIRSTGYGERYLESNPVEGVTSEQRLKAYFHEQKPRHTVYAIDTTYDKKFSLKEVDKDHTISVGKYKARKVENKWVYDRWVGTDAYGGERMYDTPIMNGFAAGEGFKIVKYIKKSFNKFENINNYDMFKDRFEGLKSDTSLTGEARNLDKSDVTKMELALSTSKIGPEAQGYYWYSGKKDKQNVLIAPFKDMIESKKLREQLGHENYTIEDIAKQANRKMEKELLDVFKDSEANYLKGIDQNVMPYPSAKKLHQRKFVSNIIHELNHQHGSTRFDKLNDILSDKSFKNAVDFNKRMQLYADSSGVPLNENSFKDPKYGNVKNNRVNFLILRDQDLNLSEKEGTSGADGGLLFKSDFFRGIANAFGIDPKITTIKPVTVGRLRDLNGQNLGGIIALKSNGKNSIAQTAVEGLMKEASKYTLDGSDVHFVAFETANKIKGNTKATEVTYDKDKNTYSIVGDRPEIHSIDLHSLRINTSVKDDATKNYKGTHLPRQTLSTLNFGQVGKNLKKIVDYYTQDAVFGTQEAIKLVENYNKSNDITEITKWLTDNPKNLSQLPLKFLQEKINDPNPENNIYRRALLGDISEIDPQLQSFRFDADEKWDLFHSKITSLGQLAEGGYAALNFFEKIGDPYRKMLRKHVMRRIDTPFWKYAGKGALDPVTRDIFYDADTRPDITAESFKESNKYILLGTAHEKMAAKLNLEEPQIKELRKFLEKGDKIEDNGDTTLGAVWHLHKNAMSKVSEPSKKGLEDALDLLIIRVPADSLSGTIPVKLGGFTKDKGTGIVTSELKDQYLGGADKDIDSAFIIQNGSKEHREVLEKYKFDREDSYRNKEKLPLFNEAQALRDLGAKDPDRRVATKFSSFYRKQAWATGLKGEGMRGSIISARDFYLELAGRLKDGQRYQFEARGKGFDKNTYKYEIVLREGKNNYTKFLDKIFTSINMANDATKYSKIPSYENIKNQIFDTIFKVNVTSPDGKVIAKEINAKDFFGRLPFNNKLKQDQGFHSEFKYNPFSRENKSLRHFLTLEDRYGGEVGKFRSVQGIQFEKLVKENIVNIMRTSQDEALLKDFSGQIKNSVKDFIKIRSADTNAVKKKKDREQKFVSKFLPKWKDILDTQFQDYGALSVWRRLDAIYEDLSVNLNKGASYELLTERGLDVLRSFSKTKQDSPKADSNIINGILINAQKRAEKQLDNLMQAKSYDPQQGEKIGKSDAFDSEIYAYRKKITDMAKENSINVIPLMQFYELSLLTPKKMITDKGRTFFRQDAIVWGSEAISKDSKASTLKRMSEIFNRSFDFGITPDVEPKISMPMHFKDGTGGRKMRPEFRGKSTMDLILSGDRTATSRSPKAQEDVKKGDVIRFHDKEGNEVLVRATTDLYPLKEVTAEKWSKLEGWDAERFESLKKDGYKQFQFELIDKPVSERAGLAQKIQKAQLGEIQRITETPNYEDLVSFADKAHATTEKIADKVKDKKLKTDDMWNLERLAASDRDAQQIIDLRDTLLKHPQINDSFNEFFIDFTTRKGNPRDLTLMSMDDVRALNSHFRDVSKFSLKDIMLRRNWLLDPRDIDQGQLHETINRYETYIQDVKSLDRKTGKPVFIKQKASTFMTPLGRMREMFRKSQVQQNAETDPIRKEVLNELGYTKWMEQNDKKILTELVSNRRNIEEERLTGKEYTDFLSRLIKNPVTKQTKTGKEWFGIYDKKITEFYDKVAREWLFTYGKDGERIIFRDLIDSPETGSPKYGKITEYIRYDSKTGGFDFKHFRGKVIDPMEKVGESPKIGMESLMRYQWEASMEKFLSKKAGGIDKVTKANREKYRRDHKFEEEYGFGYIEPERYWSRTNYGFNNKARKKLEDSIKKAAQAAADAETTPRAKEEAYKRVMAKHGMLREDSYHPSMGLEKQFLNDNYDAVGYGARPQNLLQRGKDFIDGYDTSPEIFHRYKNQVVRSYFSNISAIHGNRQIGILKYGQEIPNLKKVNTDLQKHNKTIDMEAIKLYTKSKKGGASQEEATRVRDEYLERHKYKDNADMWGDFLYVYLKNSLGHPSLLTDRIVKSMETADPLKLKYNPYYLTSDYAVTRAMEKLHKSKKFNKMPFLKNAPEDKAMRRDYFVRRLHDLGTMEAKYNLLTLLANTGTMMTNLYGGGVTTMGSAGFKTWVDAQRNSKVTDNLLVNVKGDYVLTFKNGKSVKSRKDLIKWIEEKGVIDSYIQNELDYNPGMGTAIAKLGKDGKAFVRDLKRSIKTGAEDETILQLSKRYGISDAMLRYGGWFMQVSERKNRVDAFISHALKAKERLGSEGIHTNLNDPYIFDMALKGIETTQFLYHSAFRPAFMTTALGKVLTRFKLFAFQSVRVRRQFYKQAKAYGFKEGTDEYNKLKDLFLTDLFSFALGGAFMYSVFDTALPPPWDWMQDAGDLMFGDKKERDRAFYGTLPRPIAPLQAALPPIARFPQTFVELVQGDWEKFSNYTIHTMYPGGRMIYSIKKTAERPDNFWQNFFRIPVSKIKYRIDREKIREARSEMIGEEL